MLGRAVSKIEPVDGKLIEINRIHSPVESKNLHFRINNNLSEIEILFKSYNITHIINCAGLIRQKMNSNNLNIIQYAIESNVLIPLKLAQLSEKYKFNIIQIGTDCVFSGRKGNYSEQDVHDPIDLYGKTKSLGEISHSRISIIRTSIIGVENKSNNSLLSWLLSQPLNSKLNGYTDQIWNGVTVLQFSKLAEGIVNNQNFENFVGTHHLVPKNSMSKMELLKVLALSFDRNDLKIVPINSGNPVNMSLSTVDPSFNENLWRFAGYDTVPSIQEMILEYSKCMASKERQ